MLARLERVGLVDDADFARQLAEQQFVHKRGAGSRAVTSALVAKGIAPDLIEAVVAEAPDDEEDRAEELARSKAPPHGLGRPREGVQPTLVRS